MKRLILSMVLTTGVVYASTSQVKFGITAGPSFAKERSSGSGITITSSTLTSFHAGFIMDAALTENIYFQPQLLLSGKGGKTKVEVMGTTYSGTENPFFVEIPFNFLYKAPAGAGHVFGGLGPYAGVGIFGKTKSGGESENIQFGSNEDDDMKRFDFGVNFIAGYEWDNGFILNANYSLGLANMVPGAAADEVTGKLQYFGISVGYLFSGSY